MAQAMPHRVGQSPGTRGTALRAAAFSGYLAEQETVEPPEDADEFAL
jgi:hypothetical protein